MIVGPHKGLFFVATALMCSASLYGAELSAPSRDPLTRIFTGEPNRLTLPPDFPEAALASLDDGSCAPQATDRELSGTALQRASSSSADECRQDVQPAPGAAVLSSALSAVQPEARATVEPISVGGTVQSH